MPFRRRHSALAGGPFFFFGNVIPSPFPLLLLLLLPSFILHFSLLLHSFFLFSSLFHFLICCLNNCVALVISSLNELSNDHV
ncbi:hypothetical protein KFK09_009466 [Dendrobium nobile]|uniref:Uncharacterized protein n=1 Tax=Dendrobium nobile TaxID=94219 RepID=A0A8T3BK08_DENNO|nr:hypothetical protein KFK09_009466 [Dendrobium nobile]